MRITFISPPVNMGGGTRVIAIYARMLMQMGHEVRVICPPEPAAGPVEKLKSWLKGGGWPADTRLLPSYFDNSGVDLRVLDRFRPVVDADVPDGDVVIATWWLTAEWVAALSANKGGKVYFIQGHEVHGHLPVDRVRATYRLPFHRIVVSPWLKKVIEQYGQLDIDLVPNSVDRKQFFAPERGKQPVPTVGFLYSTGHTKGLDSALAAIHAVRKERPELRVVSFGGGTPSGEFPLPAGTEFSRLPEQTRIKDIYAGCDVWLSASRNEGFNLPALEAMACRTPVVSTRTGWPAEAIKTRWNGVLTEVDDVPALARGIEWVLSRSEPEWKTLSANAYATAAAGSWEESAKLFEKALLRARKKAAAPDSGAALDLAHR